MRECSRCLDLGHTSKKCLKDIVCNVCGCSGHVFQNRPASFSAKARGAHLDGGSKEGVVEDRDSEGWGSSEERGATEEFGASVERGSMEEKEGPGVSCATEEIGASVPWRRVTG